MSASNFTYVIRYEPQFERVTAYSHKCDVQLSPEEAWTLAEDLAAGKGWAKLVEIEEVRHVRTMVPRVKVREGNGPKVIATRKQLEQRGVWKEFSALVGEDIASIIKEDGEIKLSLGQAAKIGLIN